MRYIYKIIIIAILVISGPAMGKSIRSDVVQPMKRFGLMKVKGVPHEINYQGWLGTADDTTGVTGTFTMVFKIHDARYADTAEFAVNVDTAATDNDWVLETSPANYLRTYGDYGIALKVSESTSIASGY